MPADEDRPAQRHDRRLQLRRSHSAPAIMHRLRITGVSAGSAEPVEAVERAAGERGQRDEQQERERQPQQVDGQRELAAARRSTPGENSAATCGATSMPSAVRPAAARRRACRRCARRAPSAPRGVRFSLISVNTGTKAVENEPSANSRRMKFGMRNATQNASVAALAPNAWRSTCRAPARTRG